LDEVQRCPEILSYLQTLVDKDGRTGLFVLTGSQQFGLMSGITQSLAGRTAFVELLPFSVPELALADKLPINIDAFWLYIARIFMDPHDQILFKPACFQIS
jgi:uncharacterized protein